MTSKKTKTEKSERLATFKDLHTHWDFEGPDPRWRFTISIHRRTIHTDPTDAFALVPEDEEQFECSDLAQAKRKYEQLLADPTTKECDVRLHLQCGGFFMRFSNGGIIHPTFSSSYIYLIRWRADGAFMESYHINSSRFGERPAEMNELDKLNGVPGLMSHWREEAEREKNKKD